MILIIFTCPKITNQQRLADQDARSTLFSVNSVCICWAIKTLVNNPVFRISNLHKTWLLFRYSSQFHSANLLGRNWNVIYKESKYFFPIHAANDMNSHSFTSWKKLSLNSSDDKPRLVMSTFWMLELFVFIETFKHLHVISIAICLHGNTKNQDKEPDRHVGSTKVSYFLYSRL